MNSEQGGKGGSMHSHSEIARQDNTHKDSGTGPPSDGPLQITKDL
jgi:hypothetical protein